MPHFSIWKSLRCKNLGFAHLTFSQKPRVSIRQDPPPLEMVRGMFFSLPSLSTPGSLHGAGWWGCAALVLPRSSVGWMLTRPVFQIFQGWVHCFSLLCRDRFCPCHPGGDVGVWSSGNSMILWMGKVRIRSWRKRLYLGNSPIPAAVMRMWFKMHLSLPCLVLALWILFWGTLPSLYIIIES